MIRRKEISSYRLREEDFEPTAFCSARTTASISPDYIFAGKRRKTLGLIWLHLKSAANYYTTTQPISPPHRRLTPNYIAPTFPHPTSPHLPTRLPISLRPIFSLPPAKCFCRMVNGTFHLTMVFVFLHLKQTSCASQRLSGGDEASGVDVLNFYCEVIGVHLSQPSRFLHNFYFPFYSCWPDEDVGAC